MTIWIASLTLAMTILDNLQGDSNPGILRGGFSVGRRVSETDPARKMEENVEFSDNPNNPNFKPEESLTLTFFADAQDDINNFLTLGERFSQKPLKPI